MKQLIFFFFLLPFLFGCQQDKEAVIRQETGVVIDYSGTDYCSIVIELDNGQKIQPHIYPEGFEFIQGQRLLVNYTELPNIVSTCGKGTVCELLNVEVLDCGAPIIEAGSVSPDTFPNDPLNIHEIAINEDCLYLMVSYSGGCQEHEFNLVRVNQEDTGADIAVVELSHNSNNDLCEAALSKELQFNLLPLKEKGYTKIQIKALLENGETFNEVFDLEP